MFSCCAKPMHAMGQLGHHIAPFLKDILGKRSVADAATLLGAGGVFAHQL